MIHRKTFLTILHLTRTMQAHGKSALSALKGIHCPDCHFNLASEVLQTLWGSGPNHFFHSGPTLPIASCAHQLVPGCHQVLDACMLVQCAILIPHLIIFWEHAHGRQALELWLGFLLLAFLLISIINLGLSLLRTSKGKKKDSNSEGLRVPGRERGPKSLWRHYIPQIVGNFGACLDSSFTLLASEMFLIPTRGCAAKYVMRERDSNWWWKQMVYKKDWGKPEWLCGWVQFQKVMMGPSKASSVTGDIGSMFFIFLSLFHLENGVGSTPTCGFSVLHPPQQLRGIRHALCAQQAAGKCSFSIFLMETDTAGICLHIKKHPSSGMEKISIS